MLGPKCSIIKSFSEIYGMITCLPCQHSLWLLLFKHLQILIESSRNYFFYYSNLYQIFLFFLILFYHSCYFYLFFNCQFSKFFLLSSYPFFLLFLLFLVLLSWFCLLHCCGNHLSQWQMTAQGSKSLDIGFRVESLQENLTRSLC